MSPRLMSPQELLRSEERLFILLCLIGGLLVLEPILSRFVAARIFLHIFLTAIFIYMVYIIRGKKRHIIFNVLPAIVLLVSIWLQYVYPNKGILAIGMIAGVLLTGLVIANFLAIMHQSDEVTPAVIYAALLSYLLAALMWAFLYTFLKLVDPASFNIDLSQPEDYLSEFQYYSFVTITTLGYGDITPVTGVAKSFSALEAVVGQLYVVVVIAWLVGNYVRQKRVR
jgi:voltage-gated potassium channel